MSVDVRSRPSLRRRILGAFERATSPSPPPPATRSHTTTSVLRKKRRNTTTIGPSSPVTYYEPPVPPLAHHHSKQASDSGVRYHSSSSRSSSELHTPSSDRRVLGDWGNSPTSSRSSLHRHGALSAPVVHGAGAPGPAAYSPHQHHPILFPVSDDEYSPRSHSSSDYYRVSPTSVHARCFSQPSGQPFISPVLGAAQPSTHSLRSVDLNRDLPPLPSECIPPVPHTSASGNLVEEQDQHGARATSEEGFLLAPGTFARAVGDDYDEDDITAENNRDCDDQCCRSVEPVLLLDPSTAAAAPSRRNSLPARLSIPLDGLKSVPVKLHDITPCDETPRPDGLMAVFDRSPDAGPRPRNHHRAFQEAMLMAEEDQKQSFLARASSLTRATSLTLKNVARRRSTKRAAAAAVPPIDEDVRTVAV